MTKLFSVCLFLLCVFHGRTSAQCALLKAKNFQVTTTACSAHLSWNPVTDAVSYKVLVKVLGSSQWLYQYPDIPEPVFELPDPLEPNTNYVFAVQPICEDNNGGLQKVKSTITSSCSPPGVTVSNITSSSAAISWAYCGTPGETVTLRYREAGQLNWKYKTSQNTGNSYHPTQLESNTTYIFGVNACNSSDSAQWKSVTLTTLPVRPNLLVIYEDDGRYDRFTINDGPTWFSSPAIERIANEGVNFKNCFAVLALCAPSRASIMTGLYPHHHGVYDNGKVEEFTAITIPQILHDAGYHTGFIGKFAYQALTAQDSARFDFFLESSSDDYWNSLYDYFDGTSFQKKITIEGHKTEILTEYALQFLNEVPQGKNFALFLAHKAPHVPYDSRPEDHGIFDYANVVVPLNNSDTIQDAPSNYYECNQTLWNNDSAIILIRGYFELLAGVEWSVDTLLQFLDAHQLTDSTLIIFTSDNGVLMQEHALWGKELPLEESIRIPMFIRYPKWFPDPITISDELALNIDIAPTLLDAAGIPDTFNMDGISMKGLANNTAHRKAFMYEYFYRGLAGNCNPTLTGVRTLSGAYYKRDCYDLADEFYDLVKDPNQDRNKINRSSYTDSVLLYASRLEYLKEATNYVNIRDTILPCYLLQEKNSFDEENNHDDFFSAWAYPVPANDFVEIGWKGNTSGSKITIELFTSLGQRWRSLIAAGETGNERIDCSEAPDLLFADVRTTDGRFIIPITIQRKIGR